MKKNKLLVVLLVIVCVLSVSVGFAVVSQNLKINGTATSGDETALGENFKVVFNNGSYNKTASNDTTGDITGTVTGTTTTATITCSGMTKKGEYAVFNVVIKNNSTEYGAKLKDCVITNTGENNEYYGDLQDMNYKIPLKYDEIREIILDYEAGAGQIIKDMKKQPIMSI